MPRRFAGKRSRKLFVGYRASKDGGPNPPDGRHQLDAYWMDRKGDDVMIDVCEHVSIKAGTDGMLRSLVRGVFCPTTSALEHIQVVAKTSF